MVATWGPWSIPKRDPKLTGFIWYVKLHGKHCSNSLLPVSEGIIRVSPVLSWLPNRKGGGFGVLLLPSLTAYSMWKKKKSLVGIFPVAFFHCAHLQFLHEFLSIPLGPHSSTLAWKILWTEEPGGLQSMGSLRVGHDWATSLSLFPFMHWRRKWQPTPVFLPGESQGWGSLVGCSLWGHTQSDTTEAT